MTMELWERIDGPDGTRTVGPRCVLVADVLKRLEAAESPAQVVRELELQPLDLVAVVADDALGTPGEGPALTQARSSRPELRSALSGIAELFLDAGKPERLALAAGLLQIHDFWDESHRAAQEADDQGEARASAYWHAIAHRREPDPGNASYWFRRVGTHPVFVPLARFAASSLNEEAGDPALIRKLLPAGTWDPFAFVELITRGRLPARTAIEIQREEMRLLLAASIPG